MHARRLEWDQPAPSDFMDHLARLADCAGCGYSFDTAHPPTCDDGAPCQAA